MAEKCNCWCHKDPEPEYDSWRDYFETHEPGCGGDDPDYPRDCPGLDVKEVKP